MATLVAQGAPPTSVFDAVTAEIERLLEAGVTFGRYEPGEEVTVVAHREAGREDNAGGDAGQPRRQKVAVVTRRTQAVTGVLAALSSR